LKHKNTVQLIYLYLHQINSGNDCKSNDEDFTQKQNKVADAINRRYPQNIAGQDLERLFSTCAKVASVYS